MGSLFAVKPKVRLPNSSLRWVSLGMGRERSQSLTSRRERLETCPVREDCLTPRSTSAGERAETISTSSSSLNSVSSVSRSPTPSNGRLCEAGWMYEVALPTWSSFPGILEGSGEKGYINVATHKWNEQSL